MGSLAGCSPNGGRRLAGEWTPVVMSMEGCSLTNPMRVVSEGDLRGNAVGAQRDGTVRHVSPKETQVESSRITKGVSFSGCHLRSFTLCRTQGG